MIYKNIYNKIRSLISEDLLENAIIAMRCIILDQQFADTVSNLSRAIYRNEKAKRSNTEEYSTLNIERSRIAENLLNLLNEVPDDFTIAKNRLVYEVKNASNFFKSIEILSICINDYQKKIVINFRERYEQLNERYLLSSEDFSFEDNIVSEISKEREMLTSEYLTFLNEQLSCTYLKSNFYDFFWRAALEDKYFHFRPLIQKPQLSISDFYHDIKQNEGSVRALLLLWEEEFLSGTYHESLKYINKIRIDLGFDNSIIYEYTALSFLEYNSSDKIISQLIVSKNNFLFNKLKLYIDRSRNLEKQSSTFSRSINYIYKQIMASSEKIYNNINHDYFITSERGQTRKRNTLKSLFNVVPEILGVFNGLDIEVNNLIKLLILEFDGGGKYQWLKIRDGVVENHTNFDAKSIRNDLISKFSEGISSDEWAISLYTVLSLKKEQIVNEDNSNKLLKAIEIAHVLYPNFGFMSLLQESIKIHKLRIKPNIPRVDINTSLLNLDLAQERKEVQEIIERYDDHLDSGSHDEETLPQNPNIDLISEELESDLLIAEALHESIADSNNKIDCCPPNLFSYRIFFLSIILLILISLCIILLQAKGY